MNWGKTKGVDAQANFVQKMRPGYNNLMSTGVAALADNNVVDAMRLVSAAHNLLPNERKLDFQLDPKGGGIIATVQPEGPGGGQPMAVRLTAAQFYDFVTGPASQFDVVAKNGIEKNLRTLASPPPAPGLQPGDRSVGGLPPSQQSNWSTGRPTAYMGGANAPGVQAPPPLEPGQIRPSGPGGAILSGPGGVPRPGSSDYRGGGGGDVMDGQYVRRDRVPDSPSYTPPGLGQPRYDVERNIGESEPATMTDPRAGVGVQGIIANTRKTAAAAMQNQTPEGGVLDPTAPAKSLTAQDPRSVAARNAFAQRVTAPRPQVAPPIQGEAPRPAPTAPPAPAQATAAPAVAPQQAAPQQAEPAQQTLRPAPPPDPQQAAAFLQEYNGNKPPWPAAVGQKWQRDSASGQWRMVPR